MSKFLLHRKTKSFAYITWSLCEVILFHFTEFAGIILICLPKSCMYAVIVWQELCVTVYNVICSTNIVH